MYEQRVKGTYHEMGLSIGKQFRDEFSNIEGFPPKFSQKNLDLSLKFENEVKIHTPDLLGELDGIAEGSKVHYNTLVANELTPYRLQPSCLVMAISGDHTQIGLPVIARNHEWIEEDSQYLTLCYTSPKNKIQNFGFTFMTSNMSRYGGVNEAGVAISGATTSFVNSGPGVMFNIAIRWILDNCETTEETVAFLKRIPKTWGIAYLIIDKNNTIAKVEAHREKTKVTYSEEGFEFVTLGFDSPEMKKFNQIDRYTRLYNPRKEFLTQWFDQHKGKITPKVIIRALQNHDHSICDHFTDNRFNYGTCWSWIIPIGKLEGLVCVGPPCKNRFEKHSMF